jgi:hypothetical protein
VQYLRVKNFDKYQHYKKRNPPWIRLYYALLDDFQFLQLSDPAQLAYLKLILIASRTTNRFAADASYLKQVTRSRKTLPLKELLASGFVSASEISELSELSEGSDMSVANASIVLAERLQDASKKRGNGKRAWSEELSPTDKHKSLAVQWKLDLGFEWGKFKNYCLAHDKRYSNFEAAFRNWLARAYEQKGVGHALR